MSFDGLEKVREIGFDDPGDASLDQIHGPVDGAESKTSKERIVKR
jgi:hypothetical protein